MIKYILGLIFVAVTSGCSSLEIKSAGVEVEKELKYITTQTSTAHNPKPTIIVAHGCSGTAPFSYKEWVYSIGNWGYNSVMLDSFLARGFSNCERRAPPYLDQNVRARDIANLAQWIKKQPWHTGKIGLIGFSHGGGAAINVANNPEVKDISAAVAYYPYCDLIGIDIKNPKIPVLIHFGKKDTTTPIDRCKINDKYEQIVYPNAYHSFDIYKVDGMYYGHWHAFDLEANMISRQKTKEFMDKHLRN